MSQKFATIFFTRLYILDFLNKKQQISVTSELLPISSYVTDIYYLFLFELFLIITMYQVTDIYYYFKLLQISVTLDLISNSSKVTDICYIFDFVSPLTFCMYIRQTKVPTPIFATRPNFLYVFTHIMRVIMGQKNC